MRPALATFDFLSATEEEAPCTRSGNAEPAAGDSHPAAHGRRPHPSHVFISGTPGDREKRCVWCDCRPGTRPSLVPCPDAPKGAA